MTTEEIGYNEYLERNLTPMQGDPLAGALAAQYAQYQPYSISQINALFPDGSIDYKKIRSTYGVGEDLKSANFVSGSSGWCIYGDGDVEFNEGTFRGPLGTIAVAGETITAGNILYFKSSDLRVYKALLDDDGSEQADALFGIALDDATAGNNVKIQYFIGVYSGYTGLTPGAVYYASGATAGAVSTTPGYFMIKIGVAIDATHMLLAFENLRPNIFGNGQDGDLTVSAGTTTLNPTYKTFQYENVTVTGGTLTFGANFQNKPIVFLVRRNFTMQGTMHVTGLGYAGGAGNSNGDGSRGIISQSGFNDSAGNGGKQGFNLAGGGGGDGGTAATMMTGQDFFKYTQQGYRLLFLGAGGAGGGSSATTGAGSTPGAGGTGGKGGGGITILVGGDIDVTGGTFQANGADGNPGTDGVSGGQPGTGGGGGGGGGSGGTFRIGYYGSLTGAVAALTASGGAGGAGGAGVAGSAGNPTGGGGGGAGSSGITASSAGTAGSDPGGWGGVGGNGGAGSAGTAGFTELSQLPQI